MTALLVSVVRADSPAHFTWDSRKYSSAFLVMRAMCSRKLFSRSWPNALVNSKCSLATSF